MSKKIYQICKFETLTSIIIFGGFLSFIYFFWASLIIVPQGDTIDMAILYINESASNFITIYKAPHIVIIPKILEFLNFKFFNGSQIVKGLFLLAAYLTYYLISIKNITSKNYWAVIIISFVVFSNYRLINISNTVNGAHLLVSFFSIISIYFFSQFLINEQKKYNYKKLLLSLTFLILACTTLVNGFLLLLTLPMIYLIKNRSIKTLLLLLSISLIIFIATFYYLTLGIHNNFFITDPVRAISEIIILFTNTYGLPFTGIKKLYWLGHLLSLTISFLIFYSFIKIYRDTEKLNSNQLASIGIIIFGLLSILIVAFGRFGYYSDLLTQGHRYGIFNLFIQVSLITLLASVLSKKIIQKKFLGPLKSSFLAISVIWLIGNLFIGQYLVERKNKFDSISQQINLGNVKNKELFYEINFYPSIDESIILYKKIRDNNLYKLEDTRSNN